MSANLIIIILIGVITGLVLGTPVMFVGDVIFSGILVGLLSGVIGFFALRKKSET